ncbi:unnamed protein product [Effrenium voratum]|nr:unnamed protein product [Effrenium voratum]
MASLPSRPAFAAPPGEVASFCSASISLTNGISFSFSDPRTHRGSNDPNVLKAKVAVPLGRRGLDTSGVLILWQAQRFGGAWLHAVRLGRPAPKAGQVHTAWTAAGAVSLPLAALRGARCRRRAAATKTVAEQWFQEQLSLPATSLATRGVALLKDLDAPQRKQEAFRYTDLESLLYSLPKTGKEVEPELTDLEDSEACLGL